MIIFYLFLIIIVLIGLRYKKYNTNYISVQQTNSIKGIFIWLVFMGHILPYITKVFPFESFLDITASRVVGYLQQLVVVPFIFYSGYGVMNSIKNKGIKYVDLMPRTRLLNTILNFGVAVLCFIILNLILSIQMDFKQIMLSFVCWESVGNSNWYIFTICFCYFTSYLSCKYFGYSKISLFLISLILFLYVLVMPYLKDNWWYDTCLAYSAGSVYCYYKNRFEYYMNSKYLCCFCFLCGIFIISYIVTIKSPIAKPLFMNICSIFFSLFMVILSMKFQLSSRVLEWSGKNLFPLYIYQRIPMILFSTIYSGCLVIEWKYVYVLICAIITIIIVHLYKYINIKI